MRVRAEERAAHLIEDTEQEKLDILAERDSLLRQLRDIQSSQSQQSNTVVSALQKTQSDLEDQIARFVGFSPPPTPLSFSFFPFLLFLSSIGNKSIERKKYSIQKSVMTMSHFIYHLVHADVDQDSPY